MDAFTDDVLLLKISSYLRASELVCLALTCTRFGSKNNSNNRSLVEEAAMQNTSSMKPLSENKLTDSCMIVVLYQYIMDYSYIELL